MTLAALAGALVLMPGATASPVGQGLNLISVNDEIELGREAQTQVQAETPRVEDPEVRPDNLDSIERISRFVTRKLQRGS